MAHRPNGEYVTREEAAEMLEVSVRTIDRYAATGILTAYTKKIGVGRAAPKVFFRRVDVENLRDAPPTAHK